MSIRKPHRSLGASTGDMLVFVATLGVAAALLYPAWSVRGFRERVERAVADVATLADAARTVRESTDRWPTPAPPGEAPPELAGLEGVLTRPAYMIGWTSWEVVDSVEAPRPADLAAADDAPQLTATPPMEPVVRRIGAISVHSGDQDLLAELLEHFSDQGPFVTDSTWILVLPERAEAPPSR